MVVEDRERRTHETPARTRVKHETRPSVMYPPCTISRFLGFSARRVRHRRVMLQCNALKTDTWRPTLARPYLLPPTLPDASNLTTDGKAYL